MKSIEDKVVTAVVHGLIASYYARKEDDVDGDFGQRAIDLARGYIKGEEIDGIVIDDLSVTSTIEMIKDTFTLEDQA